MMEEDVFGARPARTPAGHEIGADLSALSEHELEERIGLLEAEIARMRQMLVSKRSSRSAADAFFKK